MKKRTIYIVGILWIVALSQIVVNEIFTKDDIVIDAFNSTQSDVLESSIDVWGDLGNLFISESEKETIIKNIAKSLGLDDKYTLETTFAGENMETTLTKRSKNATTIIKIVTIYPEDNKKLGIFEQHILVNLTLNGNSDSVIIYKKLIESQLKSLNLKEQEIILNFSGNYDGKLTIEEKELIFNKLLKILQAQVVIDDKTEELYTVYAYTGLINDYVTSNNKRINVHMVLAYDEKKDKTVLYLSTPIINSDY